MRIPFIKEKNVEDFEFSQGYLFFWDKIERSNYFLNTIADIYRRTPKEDVGGRLVSCLLGNPICDGGQWDMVVNLVEKHGKPNLKFYTLLVWRHKLMSSCYLIFYYTTIYHLQVWFPKNVTLKHGLARAQWEWIPFSKANCESSLMTSISILMRVMMMRQSNH